MNEDKLTTIELEDYKRRLKKAKKRIILVGIICFIVGFIIARQYYIYLLAWKRHT